MIRLVALLVAVFALSTVAYAKPRPRELPPVVDVTRASASPQITTLATTSFDDTVWYGGTYWAPDSLRWEAIQDSIWTFDTGVGSSINTGQNPNKPIGYHETMEGWFGIDETLDPQYHFRRSSICAISGTYSMWAGVPQLEADSLCWAAGQGYGNSWDTLLGKTFAYAGTGTVTLRFDYAVDSEPNFDYTYVFVDTIGSTDPDWYESFLLATYDGNTSGTATFVLHPGIELPSFGGVGSFTVWFRVMSDGSYSDEDGNFSTACGNTVIDNIILSGALTDTSDFENGMNGWAPVINTTGIGDFSHLALLNDLPMPGSFTGCNLQDSLLVFVNQANTYTQYQDNVVVSPWIDLLRHAEVGRPGKIVSFSVYSNLLRWGVPYTDVYLWTGVRWYPDPCPYGGPPRVSKARYSFVPSGVQCSEPSQFVVDFSSGIPAYAEKVQVLIGLLGCWDGFDCSLNDSTTAWVDNIRFGVYGVPTSDVPETSQPPIAPMIAAHPNPLRTSTHISFTIPTDGHAQLTVYDVAGRQVRTLLDAAMPAGSHDVTWDATDNAGQRVAAGLYFYRLKVGDYSASRKLVVVE